MTALRLAPRPPDDLAWLAMTIYQEAGGEPWEGQLAVAYVLLRRAEARGQSIPDVCLAPAQFSAWNSDSPTRLRLDDANGSRLPEWGQAFSAACAAYFGLKPDPTGGATHYLNVEETKRLRGGTLPEWAADSADRGRVNARLVTVMIGRHTFLRA